MITRYPETPISLGQGIYLKSYWGCDPGACERQVQAAAESAPLAETMRV